MTRERAKRLAEQWSKGMVCTLREGEAEEYHKLCLSAILAQQELENNDPLTLDELREMGREPVYLPKCECWVFVNTDNFFPVFVWPDKSSCSASDWYSMDCGKAYRRKPEEDV